MRQLILIFPGQASQYVGMGHDLYEKSRAAREIMKVAGSVKGLEDLKKTTFEGPEELLTRTDNVQPAITLVSLMALAALREAAAAAGKTLSVKACGGHSLGEYAAHVAAGNLSMEQALQMTMNRGRWMNEASQPPNPTGGMIAVLGLPVERLDQITDEIGRESISVANINSPGQIILSGEALAISRAGEMASAAGAKRVIALNVSGAWHSPLMLSVQTKMEEYLASEFDWEKISINGDNPVVANATSDVVATASDLKQALGRQITSPVIWTQCVKRLLTVAGYPGLPSENPASTSWPLFVEVGPGKVLRGLLKSIDKAIESAGVEDNAGVEALIAMI